MMPNTFAIVMVLMLITKFLFNLIAETLNMVSLNRELPEDFKEVFDAETYRKTQEYNAATVKFGILKSAFDLAALFLLWFLGGFNWLDILIKDFGFNSMLSGLVFVGAFFGATLFLGLPFRIYRTFVIEERFGLNRTSIATFAADLLKELALSVLIGGTILSAVLWLFEYAGALAWLYAWIAVSAVTVLISFIAPRFLMPLFFKFTPLENGELKTAIYDLTGRLNFPLSGIYVIDGSRRSAKANAFFTGFGKHKRIALFDTLIADQSVPELVAVLAHEIGHYKKKHAILGMAESILEYGLMFFLFSFALESAEFYAAFGLIHQSVYAGLVLFMIAYGLIAEITSVISNVVSRQREKDADAYAVLATGRPQDLIGGLKKLAKNNLANLEPHPFYAFLNYSHPPLIERFRAIRQFAGK